MSSPQHSQQKNNRLQLFYSVLSVLVRTRPMTQQTVELQAQPRTIIQKATKTLRAKGIIPAQVYGHGVEPTSIQVPLSDFLKAYARSGESTLVKLRVAQGEPMSVLIQQVQHDPLMSTVMHVDFFRVNLKEKIVTEVPLKFEGESKAVKELGGVLVKSLDHLEIECLPTELIHELVVDISRLATFEDAIEAKDILLPAGITLKTKPNEVVATVQPPISEEDLKALEEKPVETVDAVEVVTKKPQDNEDAPTTQGPTA